MATKNVTKTVDVDIDVDFDIELSDFSNDEIYDEYHDRDLWEREKKENPDFALLSDQMKHDFFMDNFDKITIEKLESIV